MSRSKNEVGSQFYFNAYNIYYEYNTVSYFSDTSRINKNILNSKGETI